MNAASREQLDPPMSDADSITEAGVVTPEQMKAYFEKAVVFSWYSHSHRGTPIFDGASIIGFELHENLHRLILNTLPPTDGLPLRGSKTIGETIATVRQRWFLAPDDFVAAPGVVPPRTRFDPSRSQRFTILDARYRFGDNEDTFSTFGTGQTHASASSGNPQLLATAIGVIINGTGRFEHCQEGTCVHAGALSETGDFSGSMTLRMLDQKGVFRACGPLCAPSPIADPEPGVAYLLLRGEATPQDPVSPNLAADGRRIGLIVEQGLQLQRLDCAVDESNRARIFDEAGSRTGKITARVEFDPDSAGGTPMSPIPFAARLDLVFLDRDGATIGTITADTTEGRVFNLSLLGQPAIRFGGVGRIRGGTGPFEGIAGLITDNSVVVFEPHISASTYVLRIEEPAMHEPGS